jgi:hypothetical protein
MNGVFSWFLIVADLEPLMTIDHCDLPILQVDHVLGVLDDRRGIAGHEVLPFSPIPITKGELLRAATITSGSLRSRTTIAYAPTTLAKASANGLCEVHFLGSLDIVDQMHQHLGIGVALEDVPAMPSSSLMAA